MCLFLMLTPTLFETLWAFFVLPVWDVCSYIHLMCYWASRKAQKLNTIEKLRRELIFTPLYNLDAE